MPELPEVETVRSGLESHLVGRAVTSTEVLHPRAIRRHIGGEPDLIGRLAGKQVTGVRRRGKYLWIDLANAADRAALVVHLGMSGQMLIARAGTPDHTHLRVRAVLDDENELRFVDQRTFGGWHLDDYTPDVYALPGDPSTGDPATADVPVSVAHIATDPFDPAFDVERVVNRMRAKHSEIKRVLLDQTVISGVGNIYADEALWRARLHGARIAETISRKKLRELIDAVTDVMAAALKVGGTSFDALYVNVNGQSGMPATERNVPGQSLPLRAPRGPYFGGECLRPLSPSVPSLPAKTFVEAWPATGHGHVDLCAFRSLRPTACQSGQLRQAACGIEQDRAARMSAPDVVEHRHRCGLQTLRGGVHA